AIQPPLRPTKTSTTPSPAEAHPHPKGPDLMTNRASDASFLPARPPQHAAPIGFQSLYNSAGQLLVYGRLRRPARKVRRLFITTPASAPGLGPVTRSTALGP